MKTICTVCGAILAVEEEVTRDIRYFELDENGQATQKGDKYDEQINIYCTKDRDHILDEEMVNYIDEQAFSYESQ